ncbi:hypothetical protein QQS35_09620 [Aquibacillus sp. LR5S19]|uniref:DUF5643 domain-containing protein n=1 Tax=Aquibacillus rhizosphaerae TaxID=3051431 RepID=A0ABT7L4A7_9BACI|nr:hypothetical protein [Aquibacillus sp. LR5S19]MDL4840706.1 hypothetical protein [Aquibacillus sp. LR5S19]
MLADAFQTYIFFEIEDLEENRLFTIGTSPSISMGDKSLGYVQPDRSLTDVSAIGANKLRGKIAMEPLKEDKAEIDLEIKELIEIVKSKTGELGTEKTGQKSVQGNWSFTVPIEKQEIIKKEIGFDTVMEGHPITFDTLIIAPTVTFLMYNHMVNEDHRDNVFLFNALKTEKQTYELENSSAYPNESNIGREWHSQYTAFKTMYYNIQDSFNLNLAIIQEQIPVDQEFSIDPHKAFPQTYEFLGTKLVVNKSEEEKKLLFEINYNDNRIFEQLDIELYFQSGISRSYYETAGVYVNERGEVQNQETLNDIGGKDKIRFYPTEIEFHLENEEPILPTGFKIHTYQVTKFLDEQVHLELKKK